VDGRGAVTPAGAGWRLDWWIGADDRWHDPAVERAVRQHARDDLPVLETAMRVPGGDAIHRVYGVAGAGDPLVIEVENASPAPFVVAWVVDGARRVALDGPSVVVDDLAIVAGRAPARWAAGSRREVETAVRSGAAGHAPFGGFRRGQVAAFLHPVAHRSTLRVALMAPERRGDAPSALPGFAEVERGWETWLTGGMRVVVPDDAVTAASRRALTDAVLTAGVPTADVVAALEDWGHDADAARGWTRLSSRDRRRARRRAPGSTGALHAALAGGGGPPLLLALRALLVYEEPEGATLTVLGELPRSWRGGQLEVHDAPTRSGPVSYAVRWHGDRPALLWDGPAGLTWRAPGLDRDWESSEPSGEALLAAVPA
jgi:hypothetical protein